jgi:16S rRNA processing protein RimM
VVASPPQREVVVGRVGRPHGVRGEVAVEVRTDEPAVRFAPGSALTLAAATHDASPSPLEVAGFRWHQDRLLVRFAGVADRDAAEALRGRLLLAEVAAGQGPADPEEFYDHQLVGLEVVTTDGAVAGEVAEVLHPGAQDLLVVRRPDRSDALVPFVAALVPEVDLEAGRLVVADRPGLLEPLEEE